jgi:hypothetical protein
VAIALSAGEDDDPVVRLLFDIRDIFDRKAADRLASKLIVADLNDLPDAPWSEWCGPLGDQTPRAFSTGQLARLLSVFPIRPRTMWPPRRGTTGKSAKSAKGYFRKDFERAWAAYAETDGTPAQPNNVRYLRTKGKATNERQH